MKHIDELDTDLIKIKHELISKQRRINLLEKQHDDYKRHMWGILYIQTAIFSLIVLGLMLYIFSK